MEGSRIVGISVADPGAPARQPTADIAAIEGPGQAETRRQITVLFPARDCKAIEKPEESRAYNPGIFPKQSPARENAEFSKLHGIGDVRKDSRGDQPARGVVGHRRAMAGGVEFLHGGDEHDAWKDQELQIEFICRRRSLGPLVPVSSKYLHDQERPDCQQQSAVKTEVHEISRRKVPALMRPTGEELRWEKTNSNGKAFRQKEYWIRMERYAASMEQ